MLGVQLNCIQNRRQFRFVFHVSMRHCEMITSLSGPNVPESSVCKMQKYLGDGTVQ